MRPKFASTTSVSVDRTQSEIRSVLQSKMILEVDSQESINRKFWDEK